MWGDDFDFEDYVNGVHFMDEEDDDEVINNTVDQKGEFVTIRVQYVNKYTKKLNSKPYDYGMSKTMAQYVNAGDKFQIVAGKDNSINEVVVYSVLTYVSDNTVRDLGYNMVSGAQKSEFMNEVNKHKTKENKKMMKKVGMGSNSNMSNMMKRFFSEVENVSISVTDSAVGIKKDGSIFTMGKNGIEENMFDFMSFDLPAFGVSTPVQNVKTGDIVVENGKAIGWVSKEFTEDANSLEVTRVTGTKYRMNPPENKTLGNTRNIMVVKNMFGGDMANPQTMQTLMMMQMMDSDNSNTDMMKNMMLMQMMQQTNGADTAGGMNMMNMLPMMMLMNK